MKGFFSGEPGADWYLAKEAYSFRGTPNNCCGELMFVNKSDAKLKVKALKVEPPGRTRKDCKPLEPADLSLSLRLPAHSQGRVSAYLQLPADTPPGQYQAQIICGKEKHPVDITVTEYRELEIEPGHIQVRANAGESVEIKLSFTNHGNTMIDLGDVGMIWFREQNWIGRTLVYELRETEQDASYEDFATRLLHRFQDDMISPARIIFEDKEPCHLEAGTTLNRSAKLTAPTGMKKGRHYLGFIKINEQRIWLELFCTGNAKVPDKEPSTDIKQ